MSAQETLSIGILKDYCAQSEYLDDCDINANDKVPSWDGNILLYENKKPKINGKEHRIPVQVKGIEYDNIPVKDEISYPIDLKHLSNYRSNGGILYIVVAINTVSLTKKMYGKLLLTIDIDKVIANKENQSSVNIKLRHIANSDELYRLCKIYVDNWPKQSILIASNPDITFNISKPLIVSMNRSGKYRSPFIEMAMTENVYYYQKNNGIDIPLRLGISLSEYKKVLVEVGDKFKSIADLKFTYENMTSTASINEIVHFKTRVGSEKITLSIDFEDKTRFDYALQTAKMLVDLHNDRSMRIDHTEIFANNGISESFFSSSFFSKHNLKYYNYIIKLGEYVEAIDVDMKLLNLDDVLQSERVLYMLKCSLKERKTVNITDGNKFGMICQEIGSKKIYLAYKELDNDTYEMSDYFKENYGVTIRPSIGSEPIEINRWFAFIPSELPCMLINRKQMISEIGSVTNEIEEELLSFYVLSMIKHFDDNGNDFDIEFAEDLVRLSPDSIPSKINRLQIKYRRGSLNDDDRNELNNLKLSDDALVRCCANVMLMNKNEYDSSISALSSEQLSDFETWPIFTLAKKVFEIDA